MLDEPNKFKEICEVVFTRARVFNNPYLTDATVQTLQKNTPYTYQPVVETNETVTVNTHRHLAQLMDRADLAQSGYARQMYLAERQGILLNEAIETAVYANHGNCTDFGAGDITGGTVADTTTITVSATNVDDIVRHVERVILVANGGSFLGRNGGFILWRPADREKLWGFMQANGFVEADKALSSNPNQGVRYMGFNHYTSNLLAANHLMAGVNKLSHVYILPDTYGQIVVDEKDPNSTSGVSVNSRVDFKEKVWANFKPVMLDINVA